MLIPHRRQRRAGRPGLGGLGRAIRYLGRYRRQAALPYLFLIVATLSQLMVPRMVRDIIDAVTQGVIAKTALEALSQIPAAAMALALPRILEFLDLPTDWSQAQLAAKLAADQAGAPQALIRTGVLIVVFAALRGLFSFLQVFWAERNSQSAAFDLRNDLFAKIQRLSFSYHDRNQTGQLMVRATDDVEKVRLFIGQGLVQLVGALVLIVGTLIILFNTNAALALVVLPVLPTALILFMIFGTVIQPLFARLQAKLSALNTLLQENLAGIKVVKAFAREKSEQAKFRRAADEVMNQQISVARLMTILFPLTFLIANLGQAATLYYGGAQIIGGSLTLGEWQEFSLYLVYLFLPTAMFGMIITQMGQAAASASRIFEILDAHSDVADRPGAIRLPPVQGHVRFENVTFRYFGSGDPVLKNVTFEARPGERIALLGATGSGKTTIINLLPRFYDPTEGRITIDGYDLREVTLESLRSQIGIVLQETTLFSGTIRENIAFGKPEAGLDEVIAAATAAAAHDFIMSFPQGYDTPVGERGATLSGGQKQRIAIARALLLDPRILILDDSTSSVDLQTEVKIQQALDALMHGRASLAASAAPSTVLQPGPGAGLRTPPAASNLAAPSALLRPGPSAGLWPPPSAGFTLSKVEGLRTSFIIAQRISTVINADQILVLDKGEIVARGQHEDLMENSPIYAEIYNSQLVGDAGAEG